MPNQQESIHQTYYGLRLAMVVLALLLYLAVLLLLFSAGCAQPSISEYYYTPVRAVFIAALSAIGVGLIIYRGNNNIENSILDVAGFLAFIVAFVPARQPDEGSCGLTNVPNTIDVSTAIGNNVGALFLAGVGAAIVARLLKPSYIGTIDEGLATTRWASLAVSLLLLGGGAVYFMADRDGFERWAHGIAAYAFFVLIVLVMLLNSRSADQPYRRIYLFTAVSTVALIVVAYLLREWIDEVFWFETVGIAGFATFWLVQTKELGGFVDRAGADRAEAPRQEEGAPAGQPSG